MSQEKIGYTRCEDCHGTGTTPNETLCTTCWGTGLVSVSREPTILKRRRFPRYYADLPIRLHNQRELVGRCAVIAERGLGGILSDPLPVGTGATLEVLLPPHGKLVEASAIVRYQQGLNHGFEFVSLTAAERETIRRFCTGLTIQSDDGRADS